MYIQEEKTMELAVLQKDMVAAMKAKDKVEKRLFLLWSLQ